MMDSMHGRLGLRRTFIVLILLCTTVVWMAGNLYGRRIAIISTTPPNSNSHGNTNAPKQVKIMTDPAPPPIVVPDEQQQQPDLLAVIAAAATRTVAVAAPAFSSIVKSSDPKLKHFWGVPPTPAHLRGEGVRNRTQIGREKASLVMLVRCVRTASLPPSPHYTGQRHSWGLTTALALISQKSGAEGCLDGPEKH